MKNNKVFHPTKEYENGEGVLYLNLFNGSFIYNYPLVSIGLNSYSLNVTLVYNSSYNSNDFLSKRIGFGNGFKLNIHQYVFPYNISYNLDDFQVGDYVYIDDFWNIHRFIKYKSIEINNQLIDVYYDESGTGLKLYNFNTHLKIFDELNNEYLFQNEKLIQYKSSYNANIIKNIAYLDNDLVSFYDSRKNTRLIEFEYNNHILNTINNTLNNKRIDFIYQYSKLVSIIYYYGATSRMEHQFKYSGNYIENVINSIDLKAIKIDYNNSGCVGKIVLGVLKPIIENEECDSEIYCGEINSCGESNFLSSSYLKYKDTIFSMPNEYIDIMDQYDYAPSYTEITSKEGISIREYFDIFGRKLCSLENENGYYFYTLERNSGLLLYPGSGNGITLNGNKLNQLAYNYDKYEFKIENDSINDYYPINEIKSKLQMHNYFYTLFFYVYVDNYGISNRIINVKCNFDGYNSTNSDYILSDCGDSCFQEVVMPLHISGGINALESIDISIDGSNNCNIFISDIRFFVGGMDSLFIDNINPSLNDQNNNMCKKITVGTKIYLDSLEYEISPLFFLTYNDIVSTYRSLHNNKIDNNLNYDFYYNNKTKIKNISCASLENSYDGKFRFHEYDNGILNFHYGKIDYYSLVSINNDTIPSYIFFEEQHRYHSNDNYYEIKRVKGEVLENINYNYRISDADANHMLSYEWINSDGRIRATKDVKKDGNNFINTVVHNYYDSFGNFIEKRIYDEDNPIEEKLYILYNYSIDGECLLSKTENDVVTSINYDEYLRIVDVVNNNYQRRIIYDKFDRISCIEFINNSTGIIKGKNIIRYNNKNEKTLVKDCSDDSIGFLHDAFGNVSRLTINGVLNTTYKKESTNNVSTYKSTIYKDNSIRVNDDESYDKYGSLLSRDINNSCIEYYYDSSNNSNYLKRISSVYDPFMDVEDEYSYYDDEGVIRSFCNENIVIEKASYYTTYEINNGIEKYKHEIVQKDISNNKTINNYDNNVKIDELSYVYKYDSLGRCFNVGELDIVDCDATIRIGRSITYKHNTIFPSQIMIDIISEINNIEYDATIYFHNLYSNGNITKFKESGTRFINNPNSLNNTNISNLEYREYQYQYDEFNRLICENDGINVINYYYGNNSNMIECVTSNNAIRKEFSYNNGRMTNYRINGVDKPISYDNFGNITNIGFKRYSYNSRNLLSNIQYGNSNITYSYNYQGFRMSKDIDNKSIKYYIDDNKIIGEDWYENSSVVVTKKIRYFYDSEGICGLKYDGYYFRLVRDSIGNVNKVMYRGKVIGEYLYDAWGNVVENELSIDSDPIIGARERFVLYNNPFRYKGYYYDVEANLYYLINRYYSPELYIFLSPDNVNYIYEFSINGINLYCYCFNNPVNYIDPNGNIAISTAVAIGFWIGFAIGLVVGAFIGGIITYEYCTENNISNWKKAGLMALGITVGGYIGGSIGGILGSVIGYGAGCLFGTSAILTGETIALYSGSDAAFEAAKASGHMLLRDTFSAKTLVFAQTIYPILKIPSIYNYLWGNLSYQFAAGANNAEIYLNESGIREVSVFNMYEIWALLERGVERVIYYVK